MAVGKDRAEWHRTRALSEVVYAAFTGEILPDGICEPYGSSKPVLTKQQAADNFGDLMGAMGRIYGGK